jgi:hypothetical protein
MGGKHNKGCCITHCVEDCILAGGANCDVESARYYSFSVPGTSTFHGTGDACCESVVPGPTPGTPTDCLPAVENTFEAGDCTWLSEDCDDCDILSTLTISAGPTAVLTITIGAYTLVWKSMAGYDPLCNSPFRYSAADSTPPDDCSWPDIFCVSPHEGCCPNYVYPDELEASFVITAGAPGLCDCAADTPTRKTLTRVSVATPPVSPYAYSSSATVRWIGTIDVGSCGTEVIMTLECIYTGGIYKMQVSFASSDCWPEGAFAEEGVADCDPFIFTFVMSSVTGCCPAAVEMTLTIFDPA